MEKIKREVELPKESCELMEGAGDFIYALRLALRDGFQLGEDLPLIVAEAMAKLVPAVEGMDKIDDEFKEDKVAVANAALICLLPRALKKLPEESVE